MKPGAGKGKGGNYEREIVSKTSLWLSEGKRDDLLCRTVGSGSQFTSVKKGHPADLMAQDDPLAFELCSKYAIECKHWRDIKLLTLIQRKGELFKALQKVRQEGIDTKRKWWLVVRQNYNPDLLFMESIELVEEDLKLGCNFPDYQALYSGLVHVYFLDEFFEKVNPIRYLLVK